MAVTGTILLFHSQGWERCELGGIGGGRRSEEALARGEHVAPGLLDFTPHRNPFPDGGHALRRGHDRGPEAPQVEGQGPKVPRKRTGDVASNPKRSWIPRREIGIIQLLMT